MALHNITQFEHGFGGVRAGFHGHDLVFGLTTETSVILFDKSDNCQKWKNNEFVNETNVQYGKVIETEAKLK